MSAPGPHTIVVNISPVHLAWLTQSDARQGVAADTAIPQWFQLWWWTRGRMEHPTLARDVVLPPKLLAPLPDQPHHGHFGMSPLLRYLLDNRDDLRQAFDTTSKAGLWLAIAWLFAYGLHEYKLIEHVDAATRAALDTPPPMLVLPGSAPPPEFGLTWLMYFVWRIRTDLQPGFDLRTVAGQTDYLPWFLFHLVPEHKLISLLSPRWRAWLREPIAVDDNASHLLPRAAVLLWRQRADLQQLFDLQTPTGRADLAAWPMAACHVDPCLWWVERPPAPVASAPQPDSANATKPVPPPPAHPHSGLPSAVAEFIALGDTLRFVNPV